MENKIKQLKRQGYSNKQISKIVNLSYSRVCQILNPNYKSFQSFISKVNKAEKKAEKLLQILKKYDSNVNYSNEGYIKLYITLKLLSK